MFKASIDLAKVNDDFNIKFGLILDTEDPKNLNKDFGKVISKFTYDGNTYLKVSPRPFVTLDITSRQDKKNGDRMGHSVTLNRRTLYVFLSKLRKLIQDFREKKNLFYYNPQGVLTVNHQVADEITLRSIANNNKIILMRPCVIEDEEHRELLYEGCIFCINTFSNFNYLTYDEINYMFYELGKVNMTQLSLDLIKINDIYKETESDELKKAALKEEKEIEISSVYTPLKGGTIPDI